MQTSSQISTLDDPDYPSSDGMPMSDNTKQFLWIVAVQGGLDTLFAADPDVLVVGDLLWYPVEGDNTIRAAPDAMVIFGRPKGDRGSYIQYREAGIAPQVAFEILSPGNRPAEMLRKLAFYERYGIEEYYILDPDHQKHKGYLRDATGRLGPIPRLFGWVSPLLGIRFAMTAELKIYKPDGSPFQFYMELEAARLASGRRAEEEQRAREVETQRADQNARRAESERQRADRNARQAEAERQRAEAERQRAEAERQARAEADRQAEAERQEKDRFRAMLRALGVDPDA